MGYVFSSVYKKRLFLKKTKFVDKKTHWEAEQIKGCKCVENKMLFNDVLKSYFKLKKNVVNLEKCISTCYIYKTMRLNALERENDARKR